MLFAILSLAQTAPTGAPGAASAPGLWGLFVQSFDLFTVLLLAGSFAAVTLIVRCIIDVRPAKILPPATVAKLTDLLRGRRFDDARDLARSDDSFPARVIAAVLERHDAARPPARDALRETAELAGGEEVSRWFRVIEPLNVIGNLGPLIGLAGTVWGMILAFTSLGESGGQAGPTDLSLGISKALFHTLLGLVLAIPCLLVFGLYRSIIDQACTRALLECERLLELIPTSDHNTASAALPGPAAPLNPTRPAGTR